MRLSLIVLIICFGSLSFSQSLSENDIKKIAEKVNFQLKGIDVGNGITVRNCIAVGRKLIYQYDVPKNWYPTENMKEELIENFKKGGFSEIYFNNEIDVDFYYYSGNNLEKKISVKSIEFSNLNFVLGEYVSIKGHPKAKDVNLKLKQPIGWKLEEGDRPNIVKKFVYKTNSYMIIIKDNYMFVSRKEARELLSDKEYVNEFLSESSSFLKNSEIINHQIVTVDTYPAIEFTISGTTERIGVNIKMIVKSWVIFYEDKIVSLSCTGLDGKEFKALENLYHLITNSVIFPEQYN